MLNWVLLIAAGVMEWGWPVSLKMAMRESFNPWWLSAAIVSMGASGALLMLAQRTIPMGTAYAVWTGIGAIGALLIGIWVFKEPASAMRMVSVSLILAGVVGLKIAGG